MKDSKQASAFPTSEQVFKIVLLGGKAVGKTSLLQRYVSDSFSSRYTRTIGFDIRSFPVPNFVPASGAANTPPSTYRQGGLPTATQYSKEANASEVHYVDGGDRATGTSAPPPQSTSNTQSSSRRSKRSHRRKNKQSRASLLQFWDVSHVELASGVHLDLVFRDVDGILLVCDGTRFETVENVDEWLSVIASRFPSLEVPILLLINKKDISDNLILPPIELDNYCEQAGFRGWRHTSAKTGSSTIRAINDLFQMIVNEKYLKISNPILASGRDINAETIKSSRMVSVINQKLASVPLFLWEHSIDYLSSSPYSPVFDIAHARPHVPRTRRNSSSESQDLSQMSGNDRSDDVSEEKVFLNGTLVGSSNRSKSEKLDPTVSANEVMSTSENLTKRVEKYFDGVSDRLAAVDASKFSQFAQYCALSESSAHFSSPLSTNSSLSSKRATSETQESKSEQPPSGASDGTSPNPAATASSTSSNAGSAARASSNMIPRLIQQCHSEKESFLHRLKEIVHTMQENEDEKYDSSLDAVVTRVSLGSDLRKLELDFQSHMCVWQDTFEQLRALQSISISVPPPPPETSPSPTTPEAPRSSATNSDACPPSAARAHVA